MGSRRHTQLVAMFFGLLPFLSVNVFIIWWYNRNLLELQGELSAKLKENEVLKERLLKARLASLQEDEKGKGSASGCPTMSATKATTTLDADESLVRAVQILEARQNLGMPDADSDRDIPAVGTQQHTPRPNYMMAETTPDPTDITIVTQLSSDRLDRLHLMAQAWRGPVSAAVYILTMDQQVEEVLKWRRLSPSIRKYVDAHLLLSPGGQYPVNKLRNLALNNSRTELVLLLDVDLVPSLQTHGYIRRMLRQGLLERTAEGRPKEVYVLAAFETIEVGMQVPASKSELLHGILNKSIAPVHMDRFAPAHGPTDYEQWYYAPEPYRVEFKPFYEPYLFGSKSDMPAYDERFEGYGHDKAQHAYHLAAAGFTFYVLPDGFVVHLQHMAGKWRDQQPMQTVWSNWWNFTVEMTRRYGYHVNPAMARQRMPYDLDWLILETVTDHVPYYYNRQTKESRWDLPPALAAMPPELLNLFVFKVS